ncbi:MAG: HlyD family efflux transporter periplasmic adaptor subunit [Clostridia bacterium]|nr:HlyD family efflux transporter periplasmic adaptor subunit [Clostridia bacterium]
MKKSMYVILVCLATFFTFYGVRYVNRPLKSVPAVSEVYENKIITTGYIVKTEYLHNANASGKVYHYLQEGTKVKKNNILSTVYTGGVSEQTLAELNNINTKIVEIRNSGGASYSFGSNSQENIDIIKNNIVKCANKNELSDIENYKAQINSIVTGDVKDIKTSSIEALESRRSMLEASIDSTKSDIYSQVAGIFSKNIDGLENTLTPKEIVNYHYSDYEALAEPNLKSQMTVNEGEPICKVINSQTWYVMTAVKAENISKIQVGQKVKLRFAELPGIEADGRIVTISAEDSKAEKML